MRTLLLALTVMLGAGCAAPVSTVGTPVTGFVRVDQVGYTPEETKNVYLLSAADPGDRPFTVVDEAGKTVLTGRTGTSTGPWNDGFHSVRVLDVSAVRTPGGYRVLVDGIAPSPVFRVASAADLFGPQVAANVRFFQAQRDGADVVPSVLGRRPSHLNDSEAMVYATPAYDEDELHDERLTPSGGPVDVAGGWFDAGDFLKFTHTAAYSAAVLLIAQRDSRAGGPELAAETGHGMAWLDKMWDDRTGTLYAQVGIGAGNDEVRPTDHDVWRLPEADEAPGADPMLARRPVFRAAEPGQPISPNLAGKVAAAFALAAQTDTGETAHRALDKAAKVYALASRQPTDELTTAYPHAFYPEDSWQDDLEFAATELALAGRALDDPRTPGWIQDAQHWAAEYLASDVRGTLGVGDVSALAHADLIPLVTGTQVTRDDLVRDLARQLEDGRTRSDKDPFRAGASYVEFDSVPHTFGLAITAELYHRVTGQHTYDAFATRQRNWVLGANAWGSSFVIGAGSVFPRCPEHQVANLTGEVLTGAAVNGPNKADKFTEPNRFPAMRQCAVADFARFDGQGARYVDAVGAWQSVEPADDFTATALLYFALAAVGHS
ncbi:hydrolase [Amycolatopsis rhizosphaerae]|uniref:Hydrolase n=1 Tax=Amycolatopsis rhizosphaerae TaxID=2053003 RepID=A0A558DJU0_9PSEU|nr:glycoside hydrolase family 9 protein [Amycolatopsis rhizosphaerae]TVT61289.1 hydrolase [Amycolatopsis rhizosphaerae]